VGIELASAIFVLSIDCHRLDGSCLSWLPPRTTVTDSGKWPVRCCSNSVAASPICRAIVDGILSIASNSFARISFAEGKKNGVPKYPQAFGHAGLLIIEPPGSTGLPSS